VGPAPARLTPVLTDTVLPPRPDPTDPAADAVTGFRKLDETEIYRGPVITLGLARFTAPDGTPFERQVVHHPGAVVVVPVIGHRTVVLVRQFRAAVGSELLEVPAGKRDVDGEPPETTAARELAEEIGYKPGRLHLLAHFYNSPGFSDELSHLYLAEDLEAVGREAAGIEEGHMSVHEIDLEEVPALIASGEIIDAKTIIGLALTREHLSGGRS
jgi:8-oxo-dGTP pyrophosphatase MutT (NUDIX family)